MEKEILKKYEKAKSISESVELFIKPMLKENVKILDIGNMVENKILELGGGIAFPVNISINENAAHYVPDIEDETLLKYGDLAKIDIGVHVDGYISDRAFTLCVGEKTHPLIKAAEKGLEEAIKIIKPGARIFEISEVVENTLNELGFNPIKNLCGHGLGHYKTHHKFSIPNGKNDIGEELEPEQALAMEVFATNGIGWVKDSNQVLIYAYSKDMPVRMKESRKILEISKNQYNGLPFAKRWLVNEKIPVYKIEMALKQLVETDALREHPVLKEKSGGNVAQAEETILI